MRIHRKSCAWVLAVALQATSTSRSAQEHRRYMGKFLLAFKKTWPAANLGFFDWRTGSIFSARLTTPLTKGYLKMIVSGIRVNKAGATIKVIVRSEQG